MSQSSARRNRQPHQEYPNLPRLSLLTQIYSQLSKNQIIHLGDLSHLHLRTPKFQKNKCRNSHRGLLLGSQMYFPPNLSSQRDVDLTPFSRRWKSVCCHHSWCRNPVRIPRRTPLHHSCECSRDRVWCCCPVNYLGQFLKFPDHQ